MENKNQFNAWNASVSTVIIPVGGFGTRMLPMTQAVPKALLPVGTKPLIVHAVDEALEAGVPNVVIAARPDEHDIFEKQFKVSPVMKDKIQKTGREYLLNHLAKCESSYRHAVNVLPVYNEAGPAATVKEVAEMLGLKNQHFGVILPDDLFVADKPVIGQLINSFNQTDLSTVGIRDVCVKMENANNGTFITHGTSRDRSAVIEEIQIKPKSNKPISSQVSCGRYVLGQDFMDHVDQSYDTQLSEVSMSAVVKKMVDEGVSVGSYLTQGKFYDCGDFLRYQTAVAAFLSADVVANFNKISNELDDLGETPSPSSSGDYDSDIGADQHTLN